MSTPELQHAFVENVYIRLFHAEWYRLRPQDWQLQDMQSSFWRFYMHDSDGALLQVDETEVPLRSGQLYFVPAGVRFSTRSSATMHQFYVHFDVMGLPVFAARELFNSPVHLPPSRPLQRAAQSIARQMKNGRTLDLALHLQIKSVLYEGLARYLQSLPPERIEQYQATMQELAPVLPAICHIEENLAQPLSNGELAQRCHMSESHFIRCFGACVRQTPRQYLQERRVQIAAQQLLFSTHSIDRIAAENGFGNRFYFSRVFARKTGSTPALFRKTSRV